VDADALFSKLKRNVKADHNSKGQVNWPREAREDFDFEAGDQLNADDKAILQDAIAQGQAASDPKRAR
jgi:phytoene/squalene synthetase